MTGKTRKTRKPPGSPGTGPDKLTSAASTDGTGATKPEAGPNPVARSESRLTAPPPAGSPERSPENPRSSEAILETAATLFSAQGYRQTDVQQIADRLGIGKGTIYRQFPTKENLFLATVDRIIGQLTRYIDRRAEAKPDPFDRVAEGISAFLAYFDENPGAVELLLLERAEFRHRNTPTYLEYNETNAAPWRRLLLDLMRAGRLREMPPERIIDLLHNALYGTIFINHFAGRRKPLREQAADLIDIVFRGILPRD